MCLGICFSGRAWSEGPMQVGPRLGRGAGPETGYLGGLALGAQASREAISALTLWVLGLPRRARPMAPIRKGSPFLGFSSPLWPVGAGPGHMVLCRRLGKGRALQGEAEGSACKGDSSGKPFLRWPSSRRLAGSLPSEALLCPTSSGVTACRLRGPGRIRLRLLHSGFTWGTGPGVRRLPWGLSGRRLTSGLAGGFSSPPPLSRRPGGAAHEQRAWPNELTALVTRSRPHRVAQEGRVATAQAPLSSPRPRWGTRHTALGPSLGPCRVGAELLLT